MVKPGKSHLLALLIVLTIASLNASAQNAARQQPRPNIVLMFPDNLGWGEVESYGSVRGVPTPRIDQIGREGMRLTNFNVEYSCTVSRIALLTGRYAVRSGGSQNSGMTLWETTIPEILKPLGYATGIFGKYHLGGLDWIKGRTPMDQGFDERSEEHTSELQSLR